MGAYWDCQRGHQNEMPQYASPGMCGVAECDGYYEQGTGYSAADAPWPAGDPDTCDSDVQSCPPPARSERSAVQECPGPHEFELIRLQVVSGDAHYLTGEDYEAPVVAGVMQGVEVIVEAITHPTMTQCKHELAEALEWSGGEEVPGEPARRKVTMQEAKKVEVLCRQLELGIERALTVYSVKAVKVGWNAGDEPLWPDTPEVQRRLIALAEPSAGLGAHPPKTHDGAPGTVKCRMQMKFKIKPDSFIADGLAGAFDTSLVQFNVTREKKVRSWTADSVFGIWDWERHDENQVDEWTSDDRSDTEEENDVWSTDGYVYAYDGPRTGPPNPRYNVGYVKKLRMREWVAVNFNGESARDAGQRCSHYEHWRCFVSINRDADDLHAWKLSSEFDGTFIRWDLDEQGWGDCPEDDADDPENESRIDAWARKWTEATSSVWDLGPEAAWDAGPYGEDGAFAMQWANDNYHTEGEINAARHAMWQARLTFRHGFKAAERIGELHETGLRERGNPDTRVDLFNNQIGRRLGQEVSAISQIEAKVRAALASGELATREDDLRL